MYNFMAYKDYHLPDPGLPMGPGGPGCPVSPVMRKISFNLIPQDTL